MNQRLMHDCALMMGLHLVDLVNLPDDQKKDALDEFYRVCMAGLESFCIQQDRMQQRMKPLDN